MDQSITVRPTIKEGDKVRLLDNKYYRSGAVEMKPGTFAMVVGVFPDHLLPVDVVADDFPNAGPWVLADGEFELVQDEEVTA